MSGPFTAELHDALLRVAGWLPDDVLAAARGHLAAGDATAVARMLAFAGLRTVLPLIDDDLDVLADLLEADGVDPGRLPVALPDGEIPALLWRFSEDPPEDAGTDVDGAALVAAMAEDDLVATLAAEPGLRGLWRAWRQTIDGSPYPSPRPVYVVEVDDRAEGAGEGAALAGRLQERLVAAGERDPQVEIVSTRLDPPLYQRAARAGGKVLWAAAGERKIIVARIFDAVDPETGPSFAEDHPRITDETERARILAYLEAGAELLATTGTLTDVVDPARGDVAPMNFRTDGAWVWTDTVTYYLREHHLAPDPELLRYIEAADGPPPPPDTVALNRALAALTPSADSEPVWSTS
jgi:hypothetical protein